MPTPQSRNPMFRKIAGSKASLGGNYIKRGIYTHTILRLAVEKKRAGHFFICEVNVDAAQAVGADPDTARNQNEPNKPGTMASYLVNLDTNDSAGGNAKSFVLSLLGFDEADVSEDEFEATVAELCNDDPKATREDGSLIGVQPARGMRIRDETYDKLTKKEEWFVGHRWGTIAQTPEEVEKRRAELPPYKAAAAT